MSLENRPERIEAPQENAAAEQPPENMTDPSFNATHADARKSGDNNPASLPNVEFEDSLQQVLGPEVNQAYTTYADGTAAFDEIDSDRNGFVSHEELRQYIKIQNQNRANLTPEQQRRLRAAEHMFQNIGNLQNASNDEWGPERSGITRADLQQNLIQRAWAAQQQIMSNLQARIGNGGSGRFDTSPVGAHFAYDARSGIIASRDPQGQPLASFNLFIIDRLRNMTVRMDQSPVRGRVDSRPL